MAGEVRVAGHDSGVGQGAGQEDEAGGIAAGIADPRRVPDPVAPMRVELGQTVDPAIRDAVCRARIQHPYMVARNESDRLARRVVGQTEDHDIGLVQVPAPHLRVLARGLRNLHERHVVARRQPIADLEPGGARLAVDEYVRHCFQTPHGQGDTFAADRGPGAHRHCLRRQTWAPAHSTDSARTNCTRTSPRPGRSAGCSSSWCRTLPPRRADACVGGVDTGAFAFAQAGLIGEEGTVLHCKVGLCPPTGQALNTNRSAPTAARPGARRSPSGPRPACRRGGPRSPCR